MPMNVLASMENIEIENLILFEDNHLLVVNKPNNIPVQEDITKDDDFLNILKNYLKQKHNKPGNVFLGLIQRLDRPTSGVMVFAKTSKAAARLCQSLVEGEFEKKYLAIVLGSLKEPQGALVHYLKKNSLTNTVSVVPQGTTDCKRAELSYKVLADLEKISLLEVELVTGRSHQIRVQLSHIGHPVFGDARYKGDVVKGADLALHAYLLRFCHPVSKDTMTFIVYPKPDKDLWKRFDLEQLLHQQIYGSSLE